MPGFVFRNPADYNQTYVTWSTSDPNIPIGWVFCWSNGEILRDQKQYEPSASGGWPPYGDPGDYASNPRIRYPDNGR
jgi:hypothetical protein